MTLLLEAKEKLKLLYAKYSIFLLTAGKFILAMTVFKGINSRLPFVEKLDNLFLLVILSLICSIMPLNVTVILGIALLIIQCYGVGIEVAGFAAVLILLMLILYIRFTPKDALVLLLTPMAFSMGVPAAIPICYGLIGTPASAISSGCGVVIYYFMELVNAKVPVLQAADTKELVQNLKLLLDGMMKNQDMMMCIITFAVVLLVVNLIRRLPVEYAWEIAVLAGAVSYVVVMLAGGMVLDVKSPVIPLIAGTIGAAVIAVILEFFLFHVDYSRTEHLQYEDDDYYYYVKAVPKVSIAKKDVTVKTIQKAVPLENPQEFLQEPLQEPETGADVPVEAPVEQVDFASKLEESLKDL